MTAQVKKIHPTSPDSACLLPLFPAPLAGRPAGVATRKPPASRSLVVVADPPPPTSRRQIPRCKQPASFPASYHPARSSVISATRRQHQFCCNLTKWRV
uniref:Uncharacterized protein n=1 Tax=Oryza punctata TaxID=4537 RepID=A0A0E0LF53_ORYPU